MYTDVLNYGCGSISHTFGILVSGCTHTHVNCNFECKDFYSDHQTMAEGTLILKTEFNKWMSGVVTENFST